MKYFLAVTLVFVLAACNSTGSGSSTSTPTSGTGTVTSCNAQAPASHALMKTLGSYLETSAATGQAATVLAKLNGHIPQSVKNMSDQGKLPDAQSMSIEIALHLSNQAELDQELHDLYAPGSSKFHRFLSPADFRAKYAPSNAGITSVKSYLISQGIVPSSMNANQTLIRATGSVSAISSAFHTEIHQYKDASGAAHFAPAYELQAPANLPIKAVLGIQNVIKATPHLVRKSATATSANATSGGFAPTDIRTIYNTPASMTGAGQTLGLFELDGFTASDVTSYESEFGLPTVDLDTVLVGGATGSAGDGADEVTLDIELMIAIAPGANQIRIYEGENDDTGMIDTYDQIATDNVAKEVSSSWGSTESTGSFADSENAIFEQMAAQGQSIYAAAGDSGADDNGSSLSVDDPASQPYMVGAGGTTLTQASSGGYGSETTWTDGGGGVSVVWTIPSWQTGVITAAAKGSISMRNVPDVALDADPDTGYAIYYGGEWTIFGGTSCAAPLWAGFTALINQQRAASGLSNLGFPNPSLYAIAEGANYESDFHDIADGSTNGYYPAVTGYDNATGLGSFNGLNLLNDLTVDPTSTTTTGTSGGGCPSNS